MRPAAGTVGWVTIAEQQSALQPAQPFQSSQPAQPVQPVRPLRLGRHEVAVPVVLAPMAGITNVAFRRLCREHGDGIFVCEMVTTRALVERHPKTMRMLTFDPSERPRSIQLYGIDPATVRAAVTMVGEERLADHIDLNFGCPVPKVTRKGGGAALPWRRPLFASIVTAAVAAAEPFDIPVTVKMRKGIDEEHLTFTDAGRIAQDAGVAAVTLHGRTAAQRYSGQADWAAIAELKRLLTIPVLGNGDVWEAEDALRMIAQTGVDGVVVGRGCLGRPWLFADLAAAFSGRAQRMMPTLGSVAEIMLRHATLLVEWYAAADPPLVGIGAQRHGCADFRKHVPWYLKGFPVGSDLRRRLAMVASLDELADLLGELDGDLPFPVSELAVPRGRTGTPADVVLPYGWLDTADSAEIPLGAELCDGSGG